MVGELAHLRCNITLGGFSGERVFEVAMIPEGEYSGIAPVHYCSRMDGGIFEKGEPEKEEEGRVEIRVISNGGQTAFVAIPDGEAITVHAANVLDT